jgi:hypothetical protein
VLNLSGRICVEDSRLSSIVDKSMLKNLKSYSIYRVKKQKIDRR